MKKIEKGEKKKQKGKREKIRENPALRAEAARKEHERYLQRKAKAQIKSVKEMTKREQRLKRKKWRENTRNRRQKIFQQDQEENVPTLSISTPSVSQSTQVISKSSSASRGRK